MSIIRAEVLGESIVLETAPGLFSPGRVDRGTLAMLSAAGFAPGMKVLDLGCGCGVVGILAARKCGAGNVWLVDIDPQAVDIARKNAGTNGAGGVTCVVSDGLRQLDATGFDLILTNPPYQSDFSVAKAFIEKGFNRLKIGGRMLMVVKRKEWYKNKLISVFGGVKIHEIDGYYVFEAVRKSMNYAKRAQKPGKSSDKLPQS